jgi:hypothetical protein
LEKDLECRAANFNIRKLTRWDQVLKYQIKVSLTHSFILFYTHVKRQNSSENCYEHVMVLTDLYEPLTNRIPKQRKNVPTARGTGTQRNVE